MCRCIWFIFLRFSMGYIGVGIPALYLNRCSSSLLRREWDFHRYSPGKVIQQKLSDMPLVWHSERDVSMVGKKKKREIVCVPIATFICLCSPLLLIFMVNHQPALIHSLISRLSSSSL